MSKCNDYVNIQTLYCDLSNYEREVPDEKCKCCDSSGNLQNCTKYFIISRFTIYKSQNR